ncbi:MAG TPA: pyridoxal-phosphate dependent enzyme [Thermoanaerobaculia bacterium]|nr:pyridoxal-phosphate dependent enzyme [Thermoanaerobaculia bacterium]
MSTEVRPPTLAEIVSARDRIRGIAIRTPLVRWNVGPDFPEIWLKLENLQPINAFKIRGAANAVALLDDEEKRRGVWTISAGNAGQGVAFAARAAGIPCTVVAIESAAGTKVERMRALGANIVKAPFEVCWKAMEERAYPGVDGTFVHPFDDHSFIAGNATVGLEILEDLPTTRTVIAAIGGGGLIAGVGAAFRALRPQTKVLGAEPETAAPGALSFEARAPRVFEGWSASFVDGAGGKSIFPRMWERFKETVDGSIVVTLDEVRNAMRLIADKSRVIAEGAGALGPAAALRMSRDDGPIVAIVSGGNIDLAKFAEIIRGDK